MDPATLGLVAAGLVAKKGLEAPGDGADGADGAGESPWGLLGRIADRIRNWFGDRGDAGGLDALELVEKAPDSPRSIERLASCIAAAAKADPDSATDLELLLDAIRAQARPEVAAYVGNIHAGARAGRVVQATPYDEGHA